MPNIIDCNKTSQYFNETGNFTKAKRDISPLDWNPISRRQDFFVRDIKRL